MLRLAVRPVVAAAFRLFAPSLIRQVMQTGHGKRWRHENPVITAEEQAQHA
jgi:hypothetical protein